MRLLVLITILSSICNTVFAASGKPEGYEYKVQALMIEKKYEEAEAMCHEWKETSPEESEKIEKYLLEASNAKFNSEIAGTDGPSLDDLLKTDGPQEVYFDDELFSQPSP